MSHYAEHIPESASYRDPTEWEPAGTLRAHPIDAPEQCFDAAKHGSPYFILTVRADIGDGRGREVAIKQGFQDGTRTIRPMSRLEPTATQALGNADVLAELLRSFEYAIVKYEGNLRDKGGNVMRETAPAAPKETWIPPVYRPVVDAAKRFVASTEGSQTGPNSRAAAALARELADVFPYSIEVSGEYHRIRVEKVL